MTPRAPPAPPTGMDLILSAALVAGRRVRRETCSAATPARSARRRWTCAGTVGSLAQGRALVLGAGEVAEGVLKALHGRTGGTGW